VNRLHKAGCLTPGWTRGWQWTQDGEKVASINLRAEPDRLHLSYRVRIAGGEWESIEEPVRIVRVPCRLGGARPYFLCPGVVNGITCGRRVAKLHGLVVDSSDVGGVIEGLDVLLHDFEQRMATAERDYLDAGEGGSADERLERLVYGRFLEPEARKAFFEAYKEIEALWEILSPSPELREYIETYKHLSQLYAAVRNAYAPKVGFIGDLAHKTQRLIEASATQQGLGAFTKSVTFDVKTPTGAPSLGHVRAPTLVQKTHKNQRK
jgi:hypothetical protein